MDLRSMNLGLIYPAHQSFRGSDGWSIMLKVRRQVLFPILPSDPSQDACPVKMLWFSQYNRFL